MNDTKNKTIDAKCCIKVYDFFEKLLEAYYDNMTAFMVTIGEKKDQTILRMTIETAVGSSLVPRDFEGYEIWEDEENLDVTIGLGEGGAAL